MSCAEWHRGGLVHIMYGCLCGRGARYKEREDSKKRRTISSNVHVKDIPHLDVDGSQESLILFLELFLVKNLNCEDTLVGNITTIYA